MLFPETRHTLVQRLIVQGKEDDWRQFLADYWNPICRFAAKYGSLTSTDAEDVASLTFEVLLTNRLLDRWAVGRTVKLRTILCAIVRKIIANRARTQTNRRRILRTLAEQGYGGSIEIDDETAASFYAAWADSILEQAVQTLVDELFSARKGDQFRVLFSRICENLSLAEISVAMRIPLMTVENYYRAARKRLTTNLEQRVREHISRYCAEEYQDDEFQEEWHALGEFFISRGGLEECLLKVVGGRVLLTERERTASLISAMIAKVEPT